MGVNQLIGHGWPSTPAGVDGDDWRFNWRFYAAGAFNDRNPWWIAMPDVSRYLQRVSALLREGRPVNDVALYLPTSDALGDIKPGTAHLLELLRERIGPAVPAAILDAGYGFDVVDDGALAAPASIQGNELVIGAQRFRTVVLPAVRTMPAETLSRLRAFAAAGGRVIATDRLPEATPGLRGEPLTLDMPLTPTPAASLGDALRRALVPDMRLEPASPDVGQHHRRAGDADVYFLANTANTPRAARLTVRTRRPRRMVGSADRRDAGRRRGRGRSRDDDAAARSRGLWIDRAGRRARAGAADPERRPLAAAPQRAADRAARAVDRHVRRGADRRRARATRWRRGTPTRTRASSQASPPTRRPSRSRRSRAARP